MILPRCIRLRDAAKYLGVDKNKFDAEIRPHLIEIPIGERGIGFDRLDLDAWFDEYKALHGRPGKRKPEKWQSEQARPGTLIKPSTGQSFEEVLAQAISKKPKRSSLGR